MSGWGLRAAALLATVAIFGGSLDYALKHAKNSGAPLQPPVAPRASPSAVAAQPTPTPLPPLVTPRNARGAPSATPAPRLSIEPGVRFATLPPITFTHVS